MHELYHVPCVSTQLETAACGVWQQERRGFSGGRLTESGCVRSLSSDYVSGWDESCAAQSSFHPKWLCMGFPQRLWVITRLLLRNCLSPAAERDTTMQSPLLLHLEQDKLSVKPYTNSFSHSCSLFLVWFKVRRYTLDTKQKWILQLHMSEYKLETEP